MKTREIQVNLGDRGYAIVIGSGLVRTLAQRLDFLRPGTQIAIVTSPLLRELYGDALVETLREAGFQAWVAEMPDGEEFKTLATAGLLYDQLIEHRMERSSVVLALGGGVVGDVAGFVSATYMRGTPFVQVPTTLISQVDASVGGKVAVDHPKGKNLIGAFHQPRLVLIDVSTLETLPDRQFRAGIAEVLRYGVISSPKILEMLETQMADILSRGPKTVMDLVAECCSIKARIVEQDETESGLRATLNYGHTFAHAIEAVTGYARFLHGEAVGIGMVCAAEMAHVRGMLEPGFRERQRGVLESAGLPTTCPAELDVAELVNAMRLDKKVLGGRVRFIVPRKVGAVEIRDDFTDDEAAQALRQVMG